MYCKNTFLLIFLVVSPLLSLAQLETAYIHLDSVKLAQPNYELMLVRLDSVQKAYTSEIATAETALSQKFDALLAPYKPQPQEPLEAIKKRMEIGDTLQLQMLVQELEAIQNKAKSYDNMLNFMYQRDIVPIDSAIQTAIAAYAQRHKIKAVWNLNNNQAQPLYIEPKANITQAILNELAQKATTK